MTSFFNERTAEYALVPRLQSILAKRYRLVVPLFYWKSREGSQFSAKIHASARVRVVAMFARRPKISRADDVIYGRVNPELKAFAQIALDKGVLTFAGFPVVRSLLELGQQSLIIWMNVESWDKSEREYFEIDSAQNDASARWGNGDKLLGLSDDDIRHEVELQSKAMSWEDAMNLCSDLRRPEDRGMGFSRFFWFGGYRPVYFLLSD